MKKRLDWREVGGAPLVGVNGVGFICHGRSDALAIENAIRRAREAARTHFVDEIARAVAPAEALLEGAAGRAAKPPTLRAAPRRTTPDSKGRGMRSLIAGTGSYAPEKVLTNADLEKLVDTNDQWIVERTGIRERRVAAPDAGDERPRAEGRRIRALEAAPLDPEGRRGDRGRHHHARLPVPLRGGGAAGPARQQEGVRVRRLGRLRRLASTRSRSPTGSWRAAR